MKLFSIHIIKLLLILIISLYALDFLYAKVYANSKYRNKIQYALNDNPKEYDVVFLGSSRANNHFATSEFEKKGFKTFNFGMSGGSLEESLLLLEILIEKKNNLKNVILELDLNIRSESFSDGTRAAFMPYLNSNSVINNFYNSKLEDFNTFSFYPFYRFIKYETKIGFREMMFTAIHKKSKFLTYNGYEPLYGSESGMSYDLEKAKPKKNKNFEEIRRVCKKNNINLIVVTTPICKNTSNKDYFKEVKKVYPEIHNFENVITDDKYFATCGHLNDEGAKIFTNIIINEFFESQKDKSKI
ncbi:MAG: hypothetical protein V4666_07190 [Bacteroidota bacterium]